MRKILMITAISVLAGGGAALAGPITGDLNIEGLSGFNASKITFANPASSLGGNTGDFAGIDCVGCVTMAGSLSFAPFIAAQAYTLTQGPVTTTLDLTSLVSESVVAVGKSNILNVVWDGVMNLTGFDATEGQFVVTANEANHSLHGSFSSTATPVAEPASLAVLGVGLLGLLFIQQRRRVI